MEKYRPAWARRSSDDYIRLYAHQTFLTEIAKDGIVLSVEEAEYLSDQLLWAAREIRDDHGLNAA